MSRQLPRPAEHVRPNYLRVFATLAHNSLVRDMTFRWNFLLDAFTSLTWVLMNLGFYVLIFDHTVAISPGWDKYPFFVFLATTLAINSLVQAFFMPNAEELSEKIRTGSLDFALLKPIDTQFLVSLQKIEWSSLGNLIFSAALLAFALSRLGYVPTPLQFALYPIYLVCGVAMMYALMITLASVGIWLGRNQNLYDFWFYITNFSRYPMEIYSGPIGTPLRKVFTFIIPILVVVNVPARLLALPFDQQHWPLVLFALVATAASLASSRWIFVRALESYRSASS